MTPPVFTPYERARAALAAGPNPSLLVFDCDYTIWPFDCDKDVIAPFVKCSWSGAYDYHGRPSNAYHDVPGIFGAILDAGIPVAFLSRNPSANSVRQLLQVLPCLNKVGAVEKYLWDAMPSHHYFHAYSSGGVGKGKDRHFAALHAVCAIPFSDMVFFDDMIDNINAASKSGVTSVHLTRNGLTAAAFICGIEGWRKSRVPTLNL
jgi:magnesium-dependent phosphatase 1